MGPDELNRFTALLNSTVLMTAVAGVFMLAFMFLRRQQTRDQRFFEIEYRRAKKTENETGSSSGPPQSTL